MPMAYDEKTAERIRKVLSKRADVVEKKMMGGLCFLVGGMCCSVSGKGGLLVRIDPEAQTTMEMGARTMKGFVRVASEGYRTDAALRTWVMRGICALASRSVQASPSLSKGSRRK
jgi:hypothetical protein